MRMFIMSGIGKLIAFCFLSLAIFVQGSPAESNIDRTTTGVFWHISDFHWDFYYNENAQPNKVCPSSYGVEVDNAGPYGDYRCDSPYALVQSAVAAMKTNLPDPDFIVWTGDDTLHTDKQEELLSEDLVIMTIKNQTNLISETFGDIKVYSALGNHDYYPKYQMPVGKSRILTDVAHMWADAGWLADEDEFTFFEKGGFFSTTDSKFPHLKIIVLNTNLWYSRNNQINETEQDPGDQFDFMESVLKNATQNEKVYIIGHIPPGYFELVDNLRWYYPKYNSRYVELIKKYSNKIAGQFFGHHHTDSFRLFNENGLSVSSMFLAPGVTPWMTTLSGVTNGSNNPGVRLFLFDKQTLELKDYRQYYLDLRKANKEGTAVWEIEYQAKSAYGLTDIGLKSMESLFKKLEMADTSCQECDNNLLLQKYVLHNSVSYNKDYCGDDCKRRQTCAITKLESTDYDVCVNGSPVQMKLSYPALLTAAMLVLTIRLSY